MPVISVIVPVYKAELYLHRCVDSILGQTFTDFELLLVDDGSPDNSGAICDEYAEKDRRIHVIHQENGGQSAARNTGIDWVFANSESQWFSFIDSDDWVHPRYLELLFQAAQHYGVGVSACLYTRVPSSGEELDRFDFPAARQLLSYDEYFSITGWGFTPYIACAKLIRRDFLQNHRFPVGRVTEDLFTTHKILAHSDSVARVNEVLYYYYLSDNSTMRAAWSPKRLDEVVASEELIAFMKKHGFRSAEETARKRYVWVLHTQLRAISGGNCESKYHYLSILSRKLRLQLLFRRKNVARFMKDKEFYVLAFPGLYRFYRTCSGVWGKIKGFFRN